jgi:hypothetical protein
MSLKRITIGSPVYAGAAKEKVPHKSPSAIRNVCVFFSGTLFLLSNPVPVVHRGGSSNPFGAPGPNQYLLRIALVPRAVWAIVSSMVFSPTRGASISFWICSR